MEKENERPSVIRYRQQQANGYIFRYTLYKEKADPDEIRDMNGELDPYNTSFYSVKIETVRENDATDFVEAFLPKMSVDIEKAKELLDFLCENLVGADSAYEAIEDVMSAFVM